MRRKRWLVAAAAGLALIATLAVGTAVMAQESDEDGRPTFLDRVAGKLGVDTQALRDAINGAHKDEIDDAVARGDLTQERADELKERIDEMPDDVPFGFGPRHFAKPFKGDGFGFHFKSGDGLELGLFGPGFGLDDAQAKIAEFLGVTPEELKAELTSDDCKSLAEVAEARGKSRDDLVAFIRGEASARLDQAVADGKVTRERADRMLEGIERVTGHFVDRALPFCGEEPPEPGQFFEGEMEEILPAPFGGDDGTGGIDRAPAAGVNETA